jgi:antitoxin component YwqK of YwqJK toxin-antitoxin module
MVMKNFRSALLAVLLLVAFPKSFAQENKLDESGKKHGLWKGYFDESKRVKYEGSFNHGNETGVFIFYDDTKAHTVVATRDFTKGKNSAYTIFYDPKKNIVSEGNVVNRLYDGQWKYYHEASKTVMTIENYRNGKLEGKRSVFYPNGKIAEEITYAADVKNGPYRKYTDKGVIIEDAMYKDGQFDGPAVYKDPDGNTIAKGVYKNGQKNGYWEFYENGKLKSREKYPIRKKTGKAKAK